MKVKDLREKLLDAPDDADILIKEGEITVEEYTSSPFKFNVGDKVRINKTTYEVTEQVEDEGMHFYKLITPGGYEAFGQEEWLEPYNPQDETEVKFKFNIGDEVRVKKYVSFSNIFTVTDQYIFNEKPHYHISYGNNKLSVEEESLEYYKDITDRIKTFEDAVEWCNEMSYDVYTSAYNVCVEDMGRDERVKDIIAFLKLRIITIALNEGWTPTYEYGEKRWIPKWGSFGYGLFWSESEKDYSISNASKLCFRSEDLAIYAASQFADIYTELSGYKNSNI